MLDNWSKQFEQGYMDFVRRRWRSKRILANKVYQAYIADKNHVHMNATIWESLASFVKHLGRTKQCEVDETEKGWYVKYIDRDPDVIAQQDASRRKEKMDIDDEMRNSQQIERMIKTAQEIEVAPVIAAQTAVPPEKLEGTLDPNVKIQFKLAPPPPPIISPVAPLAVDPAPVPNAEAQIPIKIEATGKRKREAEESDTDGESNDRKRFRFDDDSSSTSSSERGSRHSTSRHEERNGKPPSAPVPSALEELTKQLKSQQKRRDGRGSFNRGNQQKRDHDEKIPVAPSTPTPQPEDRKDYWLVPGLIVKIKNKTLANGKYYNQKGRVVQLDSVYVGVIELLDSKTKLKIDQEQLETVIPAIGGEVAIVNGKWRGHVGILESINEEKFRAVVRVEDSVVEKEYEDVCKIVTDRKSVV